MRGCGWGVQAPLFQQSAGINGNARPKHCDGRRHAAGVFCLGTFFLPVFSCCVAARLLRFNRACGHRPLAVNAVERPAWSRGAGVLTTGCTAVPLLQQEQRRQVPGTKSFGSAINSVKHYMQCAFEGSCRQNASLGNNASSFLPASSQLPPCMVGICVLRIAISSRHAGVRAVQNPPKKTGANSNLLLCARCAAAGAYASSAAAVACPFETARRSASRAGARAALLRASLGRRLPPPAPARGPAAPCP